MGKKKTTFYDGRQKNGLVKEKNPEKVASKIQRFNAASEQSPVRQKDNVDLFSLKLKKTPTFYDRHVTFRTSFPLRTKCYYTWSANQDWEVSVFCATTHDTMIPRQDPEETVIFYFLPKYMKCLLSKNIFEPSFL